LNDDIGMPASPRRSLQSRRKEGENGKLGLRIMVVANFIGLTLFMVCFSPLCMMYIFCIGGQCPPCAPPLVPGFEWVLGLIIPLYVVHLGIGFMLHRDTHLKKMNEQQHKKVGGTIKL